MVSEKNCLDLQFPFYGDELSFVPILFVSRSVGKMTYLLNISQGLDLEIYLFHSAFSHSADKETSLYGTPIIRYWVHINRSPAPVVK